MTPLWKGETKGDNICTNRRNTVFGWITTPYTLSKYLTNFQILKYNQTSLHHYFPRYTNIIHKHTYILTLSQCKRFKQNTINDKTIFYLELYFAKINFDTQSKD